MSASPLPALCKTSSGAPTSTPAIAPPIDASRDQKAGSLFMGAAEAVTWFFSIILSNFPALTRHISQEVSNDDRRAD
jgi:hypothetical protein